jgi:hypothetical protein
MGPGASAESVVATITEAAGHSRTA